MPFFLCQIAFLFSLKRKKIQKAHLRFDKGQQKQKQQQQQSKANINGVTHRVVVIFAITQIHDHREKGQHKNGEAFCFFCAFCWAHSLTPNNLLPPSLPSEPAKRWERKRKRKRKRKQKQQHRIVLCRREAR